MIYIIGDVHGCIKTLEALIEKLLKNAEIVFVGDLIDRGSNSKAIVDLVRSNNYYCVLGNHELAMCNTLPKILEDKKKIDDFAWSKLNGGRETIKSYKLTSFFSQSPKQVVNDMKWMKDLPLYIEYPKIKTKDGRHLVVSHAPFGKYWNKKDFPKTSFSYKRFMTRSLFSRNSYPDDNKGIFNVFGHTPVQMPIVTEYFANIDTGACYTNGDMLGVLTTLEFPSMRIIQQRNID